MGKVLPHCYSDRIKLSGKITHIVFSMMAFLLGTPDCQFNLLSKENEKWVELYRYSEDCMERENIADKNPEVIQKLLGETFDFKE